MLISHLWSYSSRGVIHVFHHWSRGVRRARFAARRRQCRGAGPPPKSTRPVRLLCAVAVVVAFVLRVGRGTRNAAATAMCRASLFVRGARAVAAIREGFSRVLPAAGAAARPQYRFLHARADASAAPDLQRMGE